MEVSEQQTAVRSVIGYSIDNDDMHWSVECPECGKEYTFTGYFDPSDTDECECGCVFRTERVVFEDGSYIE